MYRCVALLITAMVILSCSTTSVGTRVTRPPEVDMANYKVAAIIDFQGGEERRYLMDSIKGILATKPNLKLVEVDDERLSELLGEQHKSGSGYYSAEGASKLGQMMQADVIVTGKINNYPTAGDEIVVDDFIHTEDGRRAYRRRSVVKLDVTIQVTSVASAQILALKNYTKSADVTSDATMPIDYVPPVDNYEILPRNNWEGLYKDCAYRIAKEFEKVITSYSEVIDVVLDNIDFHPDAGRALTFANDGRWDNAAEEYGKIKNYAKANEAKEEVGVEGVASAYYNYGVCLQYLRRYDEALENLNAAYKSNPLSRYNDQIENCKREQREAARLK